MIRVLPKNQYPEEKRNTITERGLAFYMGWGKFVKQKEKNKKKAKKKKWKSKLPQPFEGTKYELPPNDYQMGN